MFKKPIVIFILGYLFGCLAEFAGMNQKVREQKVEILKWENLQSETARSWVEDRRAWSEGKKFEYNYGPHGARW